jgi:DNA-binding transcriptional MerR regulator
MQEGRKMDPRWRLKELVEVSRGLLEQLGEPEGDSKRVRWVPNTRLVRYYTTLGLLDRPAEMRGRTAFYGPRHLLQILAVKAEQARGRSLEEIQGRLAGLPDRRLAEVAGLPPDWKERLHDHEQRPAPPAPRARPEPPPPAPEAPAVDARDRFWERAPRLPPPEDAQPAARPRPPAPAPTGPEPAGPLAALAGLKLAEGAWLVLDAPDLTAAQRDELAAAAAPLIEVLESLNRT